MRRGGQERRGGGRKRENRGGEGNAHYRHSSLKIMIDGEEEGKGSQEENKLCR